MMAAGIRQRFELGSRVHQSPLVLRDQCGGFVEGFIWYINLSSGQEKGHSKMRLMGIMGHCRIFLAFAIVQKRPFGFPIGATPTPKPLLRDGSPSLWLSSIKNGRITISTAGCCSLLNSGQNSVVRLYAIAVWHRHRLSPPPTVTPLPLCLHSRCTGLNHIVNVPCARVCVNSAFSKYSG